MKKKYELSSTQVGLIDNLVSQEIKRVKSKPTGEDRNAGQIRLSEKAVWLVDLEEIQSVLSNKE